MQITTRIAKLRTEIRNCMHDVENHLKNMDKVLRKQRRKKKKYGDSIAKREAVFENLKKAFADIQNREQFGSSKPPENVKTLTQLRNEAGGRINRKNDYVERDLNQEENGVLQRWADKDNELDLQIDLAYDGILKWKQQALAIGEMEDEIIGKTNKLDH